MLIQESRRSARYIAEPPLRARFGRDDVTICNFGQEGAQIEHDEPLQAIEGILTCPPEAESIELHGRVLWSRLLPSATEPGRYRYRSGFRVEEPDREVVDRLVKRLVGAGRLQADTRSLERKRKAMLERAAAAETLRFVRPAPGVVGPKDARRILEAHHALERDPDERARWDALGAANLIRDPQRLERYREAVAVWEYLDHQFDLDAIARIIRTSRL